MRTLPAHMPNISAKVSWIFTVFPAGDLTLKIFSVSS